jgi:hypothetical protein
MNSCEHSVVQAAIPWQAAQGVACRALPCAQENGLVANVGVVDVCWTQYQSTGQVNAWLVCKTGGHLASISK